MRTSAEPLVAGELGLSEFRGVHSSGSLVDEIGGDLSRFYSYLCRASLVSVLDVPRASVT